MEKVIIKISGVDYKVAQSFRALMLFEDMTAKSVNAMNESIADILKLFYCIIKGNNMRIFNYTFDEFVDLIDEQPEAFEMFTEYLKEQAKGQAETNKQPKKKIRK